MSQNITNPNLYRLDKVKSVVVEHKESGDSKNPFKWDDYMLEFEVSEGVCLYLKIKLEPKQKDIIKQLGLLHETPYVK